MELIEFLNEKIFWGVPMLILLLCTGIYLLIKTRAAVFVHFKFMLKSTLFSLFKKENSKDGVTPFAAMSTALAATVGTGNITGVALAVRLGGPGAVFWMWISGLLGMVIKYTEVLLAVHFRKRTAEGIVGGPMYYMRDGLSAKVLPFVFCFFAVLSSFGMGNTVQANAFSFGMNVIFNIPPEISGIVLSLLCFLILSGGIKRIANFSKSFVPFMACVYMFFALFILLKNITKLPYCFELIIKSAFLGHAPLGGFAGASAAYCARIGIARGLFTNEAGLGSAPIAHASAENAAPVTQGMWGAFEVFFDTIVMCTVTALVILVSDVWIGTYPSENLAHAAFSASIPKGGYIVSFGLVMFAFASITAWYYYGESCFKFLFKGRGTAVYKLMYTIACYNGCTCEMNLVWECSDTLNALMMLPNIFALFLLAKKANELTTNYPF